MNIIILLLSMVFVVSGGVFIASGVGLSSWLMIMGGVLMAVLGFYLKRRHHNSNVIE